MEIVLEDRLGWNVGLEKYSRLVHHSFDPGSVNFDGCLAIGSFFFVKKAKEHGAFASDDLGNYDWLNYAYNFGDELLNSEYIALPACEVGRMKYKIYSALSKECKIFMRPNSGGKLFTGTLVDITEIDYVSSLYGSNIVICASPQKILGEWRFVVNYKGDILGCSCYKYSSENLYVESCPRGMGEYVRKACEKWFWKTKLVTIDIAMFYDGSFKIVEANNFSNSGLYAMNLEPIVEFIKNEESPLLV